MGELRAQQHLADEGQLQCFVCCQLCAASCMCSFMHSFSALFAVAMSILQPDTVGQHDNSAQAGHGCDAGLSCLAAVRLVFN
jgi:hypothetical protein